MACEIRGEREVNLTSPGALWTTFGEKTFADKASTEGAETRLTRLKKTASHDCAEKSRHELQELSLACFIVGTSCLAAGRFPTFMVATSANLGVTDLNMTIIAETPYIAEHTGSAGEEKGR